MSQPTFGELLRAAFRATAQGDENRLIRQIRSLYPEDWAVFLAKAQVLIEKEAQKEAGFMCRVCETVSPVKLQLGKCEACMEREEDEQNQPNSSTEDR